MRISGK